MSSLKSSQGSNRIRELREKRGLTQKQLGEEMNTVQSNISRYEEGTRDIPTKTLFDLSCFFGVSVYYLMMEEKAIKGGRYEVLTEIIQSIPPEKLDLLEEFIDFLLHK